MKPTYEWWQKAVAGDIGSIHEIAPQPGFYRRKMGKDGAWLPVAIWWGAKSGKLLCKVGEDMADPLEHWTWLAKNPISEDLYRTRMETGQWPDQPEPLRSNMPEDPFEALRAEIADKTEQAERFLTATPAAKTQIDADMARNLQAQLLELNRRADKLHKAEKEPFLTGGREVDAKFKFRDQVKGIADRLNAAFTAFMRAEKARQEAENRRKFEEERAKAEAERKRLAEEQERLKEADPALALITPEPELPPLPSAPEPVKINVGGGFGRKASLRTEWVPVIVDFKAALAHFAEHPDVSAVIEKLVAANTRLNKGNTNIPGVKIEEQQRAA